MVKITLIRHEESIYNRYRILDFNSMLTKNGIQRCSKLEGDYDVVICSIMKRTRQTLYYSCINYNYIYITNLCREIRKGNIVDMISEEEDYIETEKELQRRILGFKMLVKVLSFDNDKIAVITHGGFIQRLTGVRLNNGESIEYKVTF